LESPDTPGRFTGGPGDVAGTRPEGIVATVDPEEETFIRRFVARDRRERWLTLLAQAKSRSRITSRLYHHASAEFAPKFVTELEHTNAAGLLKGLRNLGAGHECRVVSNVDDDGSRQPLASAVEQHYAWNDGTVLICVPDRLAYVEAEDERFILRAP
jgi:hypothetical protein